MRSPSPSLSASNSATSAAAAAAAIAKASTSDNAQRYNSSYTGAYVSDTRCFFDGVGTALLPVECEASVFANPMTWSGMCRIKPSSYADYEKYHSLFFKLENKPMYSECNPVGCNDPCWINGFVQNSAWDGGWPRHVICDSKILLADPTVSAYQGGNVTSSSEGDSRFPVNATNTFYPYAWCIYDNQAIYLPPPCPRENNDAATDWVCKGLNCSVSFT